MNESEVVIVGAGPIGLALSLALARFEVPSVVLDNGSGEVTRRAARSCVLRTDTVSWLPATVSDQGARWSRWSAWHRRQRLQDVALDARTSPVHLEQHVLERSLRVAVASQPLARVVTGSHLDLLEQDADGVTAHTRPRGSTASAVDSASGTGHGYGDGYGHGPGPGHGHGHGEADANGYGRGWEHTAGENGVWWRGSFLVGCDGARSTVRKLLGVRFPGRTAVERHAVAALRARLPWEDEARLCREPGSDGNEVTARPLPDGVWRLDWLLPPRGELVTPEQLLDRVDRTLRQWHRAAAGGGDGGGGGRAGAGHRGDDGDGTAGPYELLDTGVHTSHQRLARRWRVGRAFLAGDAAHVMGALGVQSVDEGLRDAANLAWKLALAWHDANGSRGRTRGRTQWRAGPKATETLLDSYEAERRSAVVGRLRAVDQALPHVRREGGALRVLLPGGGGARGRLALLTDGHLGRGLLGAPATYGRSPLAPSPRSIEALSAGTTTGAPVHDVPVTALDGTRGQLRGRLGGQGGELLVVLVAPGTGVWESRHWLSAGLMPELATAVDALPMRAELLVAEDYPGSAAHTVLVIRPDGHLVAALPAANTSQLAECASAVRGGSARLPDQDATARPGRP